MKAQKKINFPPLLFVFHASPVLMNLLWNLGSGSRFYPWVGWAESCWSYSNSLQYSFLGNPMDRGAWQFSVHGVTRVGHDLVTKPPPTTTSKSQIILHQRINEYRFDNEMNLILPLCNILLNNFPNHVMLITCWYSDDSLVYGMISHRNQLS